MMSNAALMEATGLSLSWMLTYLIHSTILILSVWLLCRGIKPIAKRIGPRGENLAWKLALVGGFVTATVQVAAGITPALGALEFSTQQVAENSSAPVSEAASQAPAVASESPVVIRVRPTDDSVVLRAGPGLPSAGIVPLAPVTPSVEAAPAVSAAATPAPVWPFVVLAVWALGTLIATGRLLLSVRSLRKRLADREEVLVDPVLESFLTLCRDAEIKRKIRLTQTEGIDSPIALWRREIVVPRRAVDELSPAAMRSVLAHELAHLERRDPHWLAFAAVLEVLCFFQPLNRLARRGMQESAELLCDDWAISSTGDAVQFAKSLAELASWNHARDNSRLVAGMVSGDRPLVQRVRRALDGDPRRFSDKEGPRPARALLSLGTLAALVMVAPGAVNASPKNADQEAKDKAREAKESKAERKARKAREKAEKEAAKAEAKAREAEARAEQAQREAEEAQRKAEEARREAEAKLHQGGQFGAPGVHGPGAQHLEIRDGEDYLIIDENGIRMHGPGTDAVIIDGANPRMQIRIHDGETNLDLDVDLNTLEGLAEGLIGGLLGGGIDLEGMGAFEDMGDMGDWGVEMGEIMREMEGMQGEMFGIEQEILEELAREGIHIGPNGEVDFDAFEREFEQQEREFERQEREVERELERQERELERQRRELERRRRELERNRQHRGHMVPPAAPRAPMAPHAAPPAPPAPASAPAVPI